MSGDESILVPSTATLDKGEAPDLASRISPIIQSSSPPAESSLEPEEPKLPPLVWLKDLGHLPFTVTILEGIGQGLCHYRKVTRTNARTSRFIQHFSNRLEKHKPSGMSKSSRADVVFFFANIINKIPNDNPDTWTDSVAQAESNGLVWNPIVRRLFDMESVDEVLPFLSSIREEFFVKTGYYRRVRVRAGSQPTTPSLDTDAPLPDPESPNPFASPPQSAPPSPKQQPRPKLIQKSVYPPPVRTRSRDEDGPYPNSDSEHWETDAAIGHEDEDDEQEEGAGNNHRGLTPGGRPLFARQLPAPTPSAPHPALSQNPHYSSEQPRDRRSEAQAAEVAAIRKPARELA